MCIGFRVSPITALSPDQLLLIYGLYRRIVCSNSLLVHAFPGGVLSDHYGFVGFSKHWASGPEGSRVQKPSDKLRQS